MNHSLRNISEALIVVAAILSLALLRFSGVALLHGPDADDVLVPMFFDISRSIGEHGLFAGMYDPGLVAGLSYWGSPSFHPLYPFYFNWLGSDATILDTLDRLKLVFFLHLAIYGLGSYLLGRAIGLRRAIAVAVGVIAPFLPAYLSVSPWPPISSSLAWLPWIMFFQVWVYRRGWVPSAAGGLAASVALLIYAQPAQNLVLAFIGSTVLGAVFCGLELYRQGWRKGLRKLRPAMQSLTVAAFLVIVLCYPYLSGVIGFHEDSIRWLGDGRDISGKDALPLSALAAHALGWKGLLAPFSFAHLHTAIVGNLYIGAPLVLGCIAYLFVFRRRPLITGVLLSLAVSTLFCFAAITWLLYVVPVANKVREVNWWSCYVAALGLPVGALCLYRIAILARRRRPEPWGRWGAVVAASSIPALVLFGVLVTGEARWQILPAIACAALVWWMSAARGTRVTWAVSAVVLLTGSVAMVEMIRPPAGQSMLVGRERIEQRRSMETVKAALVEPENYRVAVSEQLPEFKVLTHQLANLGLRGIRGDLNPQRRSKFELLYFPTPAVAQLYGIRYKVVAAGSEGAQRVDSHYALVEDAEALPRLFLAKGGLQSVPSPVAALMQHQGTRVNRVFVGPAELGKLGLEDAGLDEGEFVAVPVDMVENSPVQLQAIIETEKPALLILNEDVEGRWHAIINGDIRRGVQVNGFQTGFAVPPGRHGVIIRRPAGFADYIAGLPLGDGP